MNLRLRLRLPSAAASTGSYVVIGGTSRGMAGRLGSPGIAPGGLAGRGMYFVIDRGEAG